MASVGIGARRLWGFLGGRRVSFIGRAGMIPASNPKGTTVTATQHTEATRKKLREATFFHRHLGTVAKAMVNNTEPEAADFYLSAFLSAVRAVPWALKMERTDEWNAWNHAWFTAMKASDAALWDFLVDQRNKVHKQGGPELTYTVMPVSLMEFMLEDKNTHIGTGMPGTPQPIFSKIEKAFTAVPGKSLATASLPLLDLITRLVDDFERDHPPARS